MKDRGVPNIEGILRNQMKRVTLRLLIAPHLERYRARLP